MSLELKNEDKWINVDPRTKKLVIRFWVKGFPKQFFISTGLKDAKRNREIVRSKRDAIANDISLERFDSTLASYQFKNKSSEVVQPEINTISLGELWERFRGFQSTQLAETTILGKYTAIGSIISKIPTQSLEHAPEIRDWLLKHYSHFTAYETLAYFSRCCQWSSESKLIMNNPFAKIQIPKPKRRSDAEEEFRAFTLDQRDLIIAAFEQHPAYNHYTALIKFLFWTGCRHGEAFALTWSDLNEDCSRITISKSCNSYMINKGTKNGKRRVFPCKQGTKIQELLLSIKPKTPAPNQLIFTSKTGCPMRTHTLFHVWNKQSTSYGVKIGVVLDLANRGDIPYLNGYATRHTFATWAIASGYTPDKVAYWIGDNVNTVLKYYCHPAVSSVECPDF